jgi:hypothetical protein
MRATTRKLSSWSAGLVGNVRDKLAGLLLMFDTAQECMQLTAHEDWLRRQIKQSYLGLASMERNIAKQRAPLVPQGWGR